MAPSFAAAEGTLRLDDLMARLAQAPERHANFVEEKRLAALDQPLRSTGRLEYRRPDHLEKITSFPIEENLVADGDRLIITSGNDAPRVVDLAGQPEIRALVDTIRGTLAGDLAGLRRIYDVKLEGSPAAWHLTLTPTEPHVARVVRSVHIEGAGNEVREIDTTEVSGDAERMTIDPAP